MEVIVSGAAVLLRQASWPQSPPLDIITQALGGYPSRIFNRSKFMSELIFDELGLVFRFSQISRKVHSLQVFFAVSPREDQPKKPFTGPLTLNGQKLIRPILLRNVTTAGEFRFDAKPQPTAIKGNISVRLVPKFEYVGMVDIGWQDFCLE